MQPLLLMFFGLGTAIRLASLAVSKRHEAALRRAGAVEHGALTTRLLALAHVLFYLACLGEGWLRGARFDGLSLAGLVVYLAAIAMLVWIVRLLGPIWTVKVMIAPGHPVNRHWLFRTVRHPNYFLNILPELVGFALIFHALWTLALGLPVYLVILANRIRQEEEAMRALFAGKA